MVAEESGILTLIPKWVLMLVLMDVNTGDGCWDNRYFIAAVVAGKKILKKISIQKKSKTKKRTDGTDVASVHIIMACVVIQLGGYYV